MTNNPSVEQPANDPAANVAAPDATTHLHTFWEKNRSFFLMLAVVVLVAAIGREGWKYFNERREAGIGEEYAQAGDAPEKLAAFASEYASHPLAGVAWLRVADHQYATGDYHSAAASYQRAAGSLADTTLKTRARLGAAMALLASGDLAGGESALKPITEDTSADKVIRAEACYHLATLAADAGRADDVRRLTDEITKIDPMSSWSQRGFALRASVEVQAKPNSGPSLNPGK